MVWNAGSPHTTPGCCPPSRKSSRNCSSVVWCVPCSPRRPSRSVSTCRRARSFWNASASSTAKAVPTSPRGSTPSSPGGQGGGVSTSRATRSCCGSLASTRSRSRGWRQPVRIRCGRRSARPTTWRSISSVGSGGPRPAVFLNPPSPSSRPTARSSAWPGRSAATMARWRSWLPAWRARRGQWSSTRRCGRRSKRGRRRCHARAAPADGPRRSSH